jgi:hypothetical protein
LIKRSLLVIWAIVLGFSGVRGDEDVPAPFRPDRQFDQAQQDFDHAVEAIEREKPEDAIPLLERAVAARPDDVEFRCTLSMALLQTRKPGSAWHVLDSLAKSSPPDPAVVAQRVTIWQALGAAGIFNVDAPASQIVSLLGEPDQRQTFDQQVRWTYDFMAVHMVDDSVYSVIDLRDYRPVLPATSHTVAISLDGRPWHVGHRVVNGRQSTVDYLLPNENIQNWRELVSVDQLFELTLEGVTPRRWLEDLNARFERAASEVRIEVLVDQPDRVVFAWSPPGLPEDRSHQEVVVVMRGDRDLYMVTYRKRETDIREEERVAWTSRFRQAHLMPPEKEQSVLTSRYRLWYLGRQVAMIAALRRQDAPEDVVDSLYGQVRRAGQEFGVAVPDLPAREVDGENGSVKNRGMLEWSIRKVTPALSAAIAQRSTAQDASLFETSMNCHMLGEVYQADGSNADAIARVVGRTAAESGLEQELWQPLLDALKEHAEIAEIGLLVSDLHGRAIRSFE